MMRRDIVAKGHNCEGTCAKGHNEIVMSVKLRRKCQLRAMCLYVRAGDDNAQQTNGKQVRRDIALHAKGHLSTHYRRRDIFFTFMLWQTFNDPRLVGERRRCGCHHGVGLILIHK